MHDNPPPGHRALRRGRVSIPGQTYLITIVCQQRQPWFADWTIAQTAAATIAEKQLWRDSHVLCWVLMPDHLHVVVELGASESLSMLIRRVKSVTARAINRYLRSEGAVWMAAYHERTLRRDEDLRQVARYVIANPIRAGLADCVGRYPFWDAIWLDTSPSPW